MKIDNDFIGVVEGFDEQARYIGFAEKRQGQQWITWTSQNGRAYFNNYSEVEEYLKKGGAWKILKKCWQKKK